MPEPVIKSLKDGPFIVSNLKNIFEQDGKRLNSEGAVSLCRCGETRNKPFCDNSHSGAGFRSGKLPGRKKDRAVSYPGEGVTVVDNRGVCSHDGSCFRSLPEVFRPKEWRWIKPGGVSAERIIDTVRKCPSGALSYSIGGVRYQNLERPPALCIDERGPLNAEGRIRLIDCDGSTPESEEHYSLCSCGRSKNKPFCDGSHAPGVFKYEDRE